MRKRFYKYMKFAAFMLCLICIALSVYLVASRFIKDRNLYFFENSYEESHIAHEMKSEAFFSLRHKLENTIDEKGKLHPEEIIGFPSAEQCEYYIRVNDMVYTNVYGKNEIKTVPPANVKGIDYREFAQSSVSIGYTQKGDSGQWDSFSQPEGHSYGYLIDTVDDFDICVRLPEALVQEKSAEWHELKNSSDGAVGVIIALMGFAVILAVYLLFAAGRKYGSDKIQLMLVDRMFVEITAALMLAVLIGGIALVVCLMCYEFETSADAMAYAAAAVSAATAAATLALLLSLVRNLKNRTFLERSIIFIVCRFIWRTVKKICRWIREMMAEARKAIVSASSASFGGRYIGILIIGFAIVVSALVLLSVVAPVMVIALAAFVVWAVVFASKRVAGLEKLKNGIEEIKNGALNHKIEDCGEGFVGKMAEDVNSIGEGLQKSLERAVKSERMKSELITNVSHDLKTPLTSIINYTDLLSKEHLTPEEANDYVKIIEQKCGRLKQLTEDLFDVSRVQSGNEKFDIENIDLCLLINQAMAELNEKIKASGLIFKFSHTSKEIFVMADGRKMSRVFENLIVNCIKYSMKNTRVYINVSENENTVTVEMKNIAGYEMDFDAEEITERFARGDRARNSEGNGLGLAIVKSYVEGCGGTVNVSVDGDLFKVIITFNKF